MRVDGVNGYTNVNYGRIARGKRINSAADDAAGLTQVSKLDEQNNGLKAGAENVQSGINLTKVADGALGGIQDYLQSIREASVKALNGTMSKSDRQAIQSEINGYLKGIDELAGSTTYNTKHILSNEEVLGMAVNPDGSGPSVSTANSVLKELGLEGYDVTSGKFDLSRVDKAIDKVSSMRSSMGATANALGRAYNYNMNASENLTGATSRIEDMDMPKAISEQKKNEVLEEYKNVMLRKQMEQESLITKMLQ